MTLLLEIVSAVLGIVAIVFAITHTLHFRENATKLKSVTTGLQGVSGELAEIAMTLPTHDIGEFPEYVGELAEMIGKAKHRIIIVCDVPCYCTFSDRTLWGKYWSALYAAKQRGVDSKSPSISLTWMDPKCRKMVLEEQFDPNSEWKTGIEKQLTTFLAAEGSTETVETLDFDKFEKIVEQAHISAIAQLKHPYTEVHRSPLHLYFWIIDDEAVFAIPNYVNRGKGRAIYTRDRRIIGGLEAIHDRLQRERRSGDSHAVAYVIKFVADMGKAVSFYRDVLGLALKFESPDWSEFVTGETTLALHPASDKNPAGKVELGFTVADVEAFYRDMSTKGVVFSMPPKKQDFGGVLAQFVDSEGAHCSVGAEAA